MPDYAPVFEGDDAPVCDESCPAHDGKRCRLKGTRAHVGHVCEPWAKDALAALRSIQSTLMQAGLVHHAEGHAPQPPQLEEVPGVVRYLVDRLSSAEAEMEYQAARKRCLEKILRTARRFVVGAPERLMDAIERALELSSNDVPNGGGDHA